MDRKYLDDSSYMSYYLDVGEIAMVEAINILDILSRRRRDLGMPLGELGHRCGVSISTLKRVMGGEVKASFSTVAAIADSLGVHFETAPTEDIASMRERQALDKARSLVAQVQGTSALEAQAVGRTDIKLMEQRTVAELLAGSSNRLWKH
jgi:transcriptional regulator with XRE-family HTH domain